MKIKSISYKIVYFVYTLLFVLLVSCSTKDNKTIDESPEINIAVGIGKVVPQGGVSKLASTAKGVVTDICVAVGDRVQKGDTLIIIDNIDATLSISELKSKYQTQLNNIAATKLRVKQSDTKINEIERKLVDSRELYQAGAISAESLKLLENEFDIEKIQENTFQKEVLIQESMLREIESQLITKRNELDKTILTAPIDGVILDIIPHKGESVQVYDTYTLLAPDSPLIVKAEIDEMFSSKIKKGQSCEIFVSGNPYPISKGKIITISPDLKQKSLFSDSGQDFQDRRVRIIEVSLDDNIEILIDTKVECRVNLD